jgi:AcrR family transcriptional regulator
VPRTAAPTDTRDALLQAANRVILRDGSGKLTLDAVAREANVSKGGLLYHFKNKEALIFGLLESHLAQFERALEEGMDGTPGAWTRAFVRASVAELTSSDAPEMDAALLAAVGENPGLLEPFRARARAWQASAESDGIDPTTATLVRLATDGLYYTELFDLGQPSPELRAKVVERMLEMASPPKAATARKRKVK